MSKTRLGLRAIALGAVVLALVACGKTSNPISDVPPNSSKPSAATVSLKSTELGDVELVGSCEVTESRLAVHASADDQGSLSTDYVQVALEGGTGQTSFPPARIVTLLFRRAGTAYAPVDPVVKSIAADGSRGEITVARIAPENDATFDTASPIAIAWSCDAP